MSSELSDLNSRNNSLLDYEPSGQFSNTSNNFKMISSKAMLKAQDYRARVVTFYNNGDPYKPQFKVTIMRNRDFPTFGKLLDHLTDRTKLPIKFVFDTDGKRISSVDELEHSNNYVCSQTSKFYNAKYGSKSLKSNFRTTNFSDIRPFLRPLRPLSSKNKYNTRSTGTNSYNSSESSLENKSMNGVIKKSIFNKNNNENEEDNSLINDSNKKLDRGPAKFIKEKVVTIINRKLPAKSSRVLLSLRSARSFENVIKDLGESVSLPLARILLTPFGNEVRSISQLRRSLNEIDTFFVDDLQLETIEDWNKRNSNENRNKGNSSKKIDQNNNELIETKNELIERLSLAASDDLNKNTTNDEKINKSNKKVVMVTPVFNESLNRQSNLEQFDAISIDSFDTIPDSDNSNQISTQFNSFLPQSSLLNGFTVEFKIDNTNLKNDKKMIDKGIQVDISYIPLEKNDKNNSKFTDNFKNTNCNNCGHKYSNSTNFSNNNNDLQVPSFYVLDDLFGENFKRKRSFIKNKNLELIRSEMNSRLNDKNNLSNSISSNSRRTGQNVELDNLHVNNLNVNNQLSNDNNHINGPISELSELSSLTEPNSLNNSRSSFRDETNSFSNSVTPDPSNNNQSKFNKTNEMASPMPSSPNNRQFNNNLISQLNQLNHNNDNSVNNDNKAIKIYESKLIEGSKVPEKSFRLKKIFGYNGDTIGNNLFILSTGEIAYYVGIFVCMWDPINNIQRHYFEHTEDICWLNVDHKEKMIVSVQKGHETALPIVKIWNYLNLETLFSTSNFELGANILSCVFSKSGFLLILVLINNNIEFYYYDWKNNRLIAKIQQLLKNEEIYGACFHPTDDNCYLSFGKRHLCLWLLENNELINKKTFKNVLKGNGLCITCLTFLDIYLVAADSDGLIFIWSSVGDDPYEFELVVNEIKAHDSSISSILTFPNRYIVTGDQNGVLKTWSFDNSQLNLLNVAFLPPSSGAIRSLSLASEIIAVDPNYFRNNIENEKLFKIYIGTSTNVGHTFNIRAIAVDSVEKYFYTAGMDHKICKWSKNLLLWCVLCKYPSTSLAVYPNSEILAVGCTNGLICILNTVSSEFITQISISNSAIGSLAYSPDNLLLAAGTENGVLHILPVFDNGNSYDRISALKCNYPILNLQWSSDCKKILTSINDNDFQEILLWDLNGSTNFKKGVSIINEQITWYNACCLSGDDVIGVWENDNLENVINLCCHCDETNEFIVTGDENGNIRLFKYPCVESNAAFYAAKQSSNAVTEVRFLNKNSNCLVTSCYNGSIYVWDFF